MKRICLVASGLRPHCLRLQPWRYLHEIAAQLQSQGNEVTFISDGGPAEPDEHVDGVALRRLPSVRNSRWKPNALLHAALTELAPAVVIWHLGKTSFFHQNFVFAGATNLGILTSPLYRAQELAALGLRRLVKGYQLSAIHIAGTLLPDRIVCNALQRNQLDGLVVQTRTTQDRLIEFGIQPEAIRVIAPGVDAIWQQQSADEALRGELGYRPEDKVIVYFGSPAPLRGLHTLLRAFEIARRSDPALKLLILSRRHANELSQEDAALGRLLRNRAIGPHVHVTSGYLAPDALTRHIAAADVVALPFELVPSDAPLSLLEAMALGKPIVTTTAGCLAELVAPGLSYLAQPADVASLVRALERATHGARGMLTGRHEFRPPARSWVQMGAEWSHFVQSR